ncbi:hypothetical protein KSP40_PGU014772 [Platanthera guangdongensis]|uniref:Dehydrin n=1 Tax=Platanthera guangdongensis TaxID=2320717 RepID=A0ABR2N2Y2_9ASPA
MTHPLTLNILHSSISSHSNQSFEVEEYGSNPVGPTDASGNPIQHGTAGHATGSLGEQLAGGQEGSPIGRATGKLRRSGSSSSSSSSEDDGMGGRRKKGIKEKVKEKLPGRGGHKKDTDRPQQYYQGGAAATVEQPH